MGEPAGSGVRGGAESPSLSDDEEYQKLDSEALWQQAQKGDTAAGGVISEILLLLPAMRQGLDLLLKMRRSWLAMLALLLQVHLAAASLCYEKPPQGFSKLHSQAGFMMHRRSLQGWCCSCRACRFWLCWLPTTGSFKAATQEPLEGLWFAAQVTVALQAAPLQPLRSQSWWRLKTMTELLPSWPLPSRRSSNSTTTR